MNFINVLKKLIIKSQFYVSFCATLLGIFVWKEQETYQNSLAIILFLTFWNGYIFTVFHKRKDAIFINWVGFAIISFLIFKFQQIDFFVKWLIVLSLGVLYNGDFFKINLREFSLIKTFYVGFVWAMTLVWLPFETFHLEWFLIVFLFISGITFPFEIRDLKRDHFPTLPKILGVRNTKYLSYIFLALSSVLATFSLKFEFAISFFFTSIFASILIYFSNRKREDWYYSFLMESLSLLPFLIYFILNLKS